MQVNLFGIYLFITFISFENILGSVLLKYNLVILARLTLFFKYAIFLILGGVGLFKSKKGPIELFLLLSYFFMVALLIVIYFLLDISSGYFYLYLFPVLIFFSGYNSRSISFESIVKISRYFLLVQVAFGLIDYLFLGEVFWSEGIEYGKYIAIIKQMPQTVLFNLPGNFYFDPYFLKIRRFIGTMGDPLALAYSLIPTICVLQRSKYKKAYLVSVIVLLATMTRAVIIGFVILYFAKKIFKKHSIVIYFLGITAISFFLPGLLKILTFSIRLDSSTLGHVLSLEKAANYMLGNLFLGEVINESVMIFEPGLINIFINFGITPFLYFIMFLFCLSYKFYKKFPLAYDIIFIGFSTITIFSQSFLSTSASWFAWFLIGYYTSKLNNQGTYFVCETLEIN